MLDRSIYLWAWTDQQFLSGFLCLTGLFSPLQFKLINVMSSRRDAEFEFGHVIQKMRKANGKGMACRKVINKVLVTDATKRKTQNNHKKQKPIQVGRSASPKMTRSTPPPNSNKNSCLEVHSPSYDTFPRGVPRPPERHSLPSVFWVFYRWDVPWTPHQGNVREAP